MNPGDDSSPPTFLPRDADHSFDSIRGGHDENETAAKESSENTLPTFAFRTDVGRDEIGAQKTGPFVAIRRVGRGGFGQVWEAVQTSLNRRIAIKQLHIKAENAEEAREFDRMFRQEAFTTAALDHPNIVPVYDFGTDEEGRPVLAMKLVRGESWNAVIANDMRTLTPQEVLLKNLPVLLNVTQAVVFAHDAGIVHRDLKPAQVMLGKYGEVLLMDWGLAILTGEEEADSPLTAHDRSCIAPNPSQASAPAGTPAFMAPEQTLDDGSLIGPWTDVYLLGGILYVLLTGTRPHEAPTGAAAIELARIGVVQDPRLRAPGRAMPEDLVALAMQALAAQPRARVASAREFLAALQEHISGASKRRESVAISNRVLARLEPVPGDYSVLTECLNELDQARLLWPENDAAIAGREKLLDAQARLALRAGDLLLAGVTIERLGSPEARQSLQAELRRVADERKRRERERAIFRYATAMLGIIVISGGSWFLFRINEERRLALSARDRAEQLLDFMIGDLRTQLRAVGKLNVMDSIGTKAEEYLGSLPASDQDSKALLQRIKTTTQLANVRIDQGDLVGARERLEKVTSLLDEGSTREDREIEWIQVAAESHAAWGRTLLEEGNVDDSFNAFASAVDRYRQLLRTDSANQEWLSRMADSLAGMADTRTTLERPRESIPFYDEAIGIYRRLNSADPENPVYAQELAHVILNKSYGLAKAGDGFDQVRPLVEESLAIFDAAIAAHPEDMGLLAAYSVHLGDSRLPLIEAQDPEDPLPTIEKAVVMLRRVVASDPTNRTWQALLYAKQISLGLFLNRAGRKEEGLSVFEESWGGLRKLLEVNPQSIMLKRDLLQCCSLLAPIYKADKRFVEAARASDITLRACEDAVFGPKRIKMSAGVAEEVVLSLGNSAATIYIQGDTKTATYYLKTTARYLPMFLETKLDDVKVWDSYSSARALLVGEFAQQKNIGEISKLNTMFEGLLAKAPVEVRESKSIILGAVAPSLIQGDQLAAAKDYVGAIKVYRAVEGKLNGVIGGHPEEGRVGFLLLSQVFRRIGNVHLGKEDIESARAALAEEEAAYAQMETFATLPGESNRLAQDFALVGMLALRARIQKLDGKVTEAEFSNRNILSALSHREASNDARVLAFRAVALLNLGRLEEAEPLIARIREAGDIPAALQTAIDEAEAEAAR